MYKALLCTGRLIEWDSDALVPWRGSEGGGGVAS